MYCFLFLSFLSGVLELGSVYIGIKQELPTVLIMALPFLYQIGNLMMSYVPRKRRLFAAMGIMVIILSLLQLNNWRYPAFAVQIIFSLFCIQAARETYKKQCPAWMKRSFRIAGFAASPLTLIANGQLVLLASSCFSVMLLLRSRADSSSALSFGGGFKGVSLVMIFHQMHYFVYTYIMPIYVFRLTEHYFISALAFAVTWIVYLTPQTVAERNGITKYKEMFFLCHSFLAVCLGMMSLFSSYSDTYAVLTLWLLTGFGGGSVFCIKHLSDKYKNTDMDLSENIGHVLGPAVAMLICSIAPGSEVIYLTLAAYICVLLAIVSGAFIQLKEGRKNEEK